MIPKRFVYKVYGITETLWDVAEWDVDVWDSVNSLLAIWNDEVISEPSFRAIVNGSASELVISLARDFNDFGEEEDVAIGNKVDMYVYDDDSPNGTLLYSGYVSAYEPILEEKREWVEVTVLGIGQDLYNIILQDSSGNTAIEYLSEDPSDILRDIITKYRNQNGQITAGTIDDTGTTVSYLFNLVNCGDAIEKVVELAPDNWYFRVNADGTLDFRLRATTATHKLDVGKNIKSMRGRKTSEQLVNEVYFVGGIPVGDEQVYRKISSSSSIDTYGRKATKMIDQRVTNDATASLLATRKVSEFSSPITRLELEIIDSNVDATTGYDIETIKPGDSIQVRNLRFSRAGSSKWDISQWDVDVWNAPLSTSLAEVLIVTSISYRSDILTIEAADRLPEVSKRIEDIQRNLEDSIAKDIPIIPD